MDFNYFYTYTDNMFQHSIFIKYLIARTEPNDNYKFLNSGLFEKPNNLYLK